MSQAYSSPAVPVTYPGKTLGIVGLVLAFVFTLAGLIVSIIAFRQSKAAGFANTPAKIGMILSIIFIALGVVTWIIVAIVVASSGAVTVTTN